MEPIAATTNPFGGIIPTPEALDPDPAAFAERLRVSLAAWKDEGYRVVWLEGPDCQGGVGPRGSGSRVYIPTTAATAI